ncbi:SCP-like extracellular [Ancylobacter novellus DSM 506]|uniref:SCP-like extracellular n=1 Tax=Ancylobacter novellus (strain ATCC 8093 / DSM 506 / JCM 20403 / CCM 1077 / IAM 12100 / NBRC 12443 / NCIMB 10456) TaxID=639283 RepID=D7A8N3_ANCN5|nr:CAP domain-containing protein [Ancylobacter novellus]ADH90567.1 SCP-like extracellular [Ancylobacter novellus DSM 506]
MPSLFLKRLAGALLLPLLIAGCATEPSSSPVDETFYANIAKGGALDPQAAANLISDYRRGRGLPAVTIDPGLMAVAERQAKAMAAADQLSHNIGGRGLTVRLKAAGFTGLRAAENVGAGYHTLAEAFSGWRDSPSHNKNMLLPGATRLGIAAVRAPRSKYSVYWAMVIAVPDPKVEAAAAAGGAAPAKPAPGPKPGETQLLINGAPAPGQ